MRNQVFKKLFSVLLALIMVAGLLPASAMAGGWGAMDVDTTPVPTEAVQPTESAEPTKPAETETPEELELGHRSSRAYAREPRGHGRAHAGRTHCRAHG